ncbi:outer membrane protein assembly factor BamE [Methyloglobulus morosus KoM1]|uniref:Outer membrane protein assembly factor BamE n=1 Tax=Methyloglobulus morosus KoM1 TaxID=1116472 RepID=V5BDT7_9GAMM|nr:outer membrane protein assembly factor BamE [Methyloglobulus morosus]ESS71470.1 outer membrane protein assembly factor BamE [Methyloglobulus morosus KoM1]
MRSVFFCIVLLGSWLLVSCSYLLDHLPGVYTIPIQQGNIVDQTMIDQLRPNMTERQVLYIMGSPMLVDTFHQKRWDYLYSSQPSGEDRQQKRVSVMFDENDLVSGIQGDFRPSSTPVVKPSEETTVDVPRREIERTMWQKIKGLFGFDDIDDAPRKDPDAKPADSGSQIKTPL